MNAFSTVCLEYRWACSGWISSGACLPQSDCCCYCVAWIWSGGYNGRRHPGRTREDQQEEEEENNEGVQQKIMTVMGVQQWLLSVGCWDVFVDRTAFVVLVNVSGWPLFLVCLIRS